METPELEARMDLAIRNGLDRDGSLLLHLQPARHLWSGHENHAEALLRLCVEEKILEPHRFRAVADDSGLTGAIDRWVAREAIDVLARNKGFRRRLRLEIGISASSLHDFDLVALLDRRLTECRVSPRNLALTLAEAVAVAQPDAADLFGRRIRALGCRFALDRVGGLHGEVTEATEDLLLGLPVDYVKLSGTLVRDLPSNPGHQESIRELVAMTGRVGVDTMGVCVLDEPTVQLLEMLGVDYAQGPHIAPPAPLPEEVLAPEPERWEPPSHDDDDTAGHHIEDGAHPVGV